MIETLETIYRSHAAGRVREALEQARLLPGLPAAVAAAKGRLPLKILTATSAEAVMRHEAERVVKFVSRRLPGPLFPEINEVRGREVVRRALDYEDEVPATFVLANATTPLGVAMVGTERNEVFYAGPRWSEPSSAIKRVYGALLWSEIGDRCLADEYPIGRRIPEAIYMTLGSKYFGARLMSLASLALIQEVVGDARLPIVVQDKCAPGPFETDAIRRMGFHGPIEVLPNYPLTQVEKLWIAYLPIRWGDRMTSCSIAMDLLRQRLGVASELAPSANDRVYLSRRDAVRRGVNNEPALIEMLERKGFRIIECSAMSAAERTEALRNARVIVGPVGSNLSNSIFAPRGAWVVEFVPTQYRTPEIRDGIAHFVCSCGQRYVRAPCEADVRPGQRYTDANLTVDLDHIETALEFVAGQPR